MQASGWFEGFGAEGLHGARLLVVLSRQDWVIRGDNGSRITQRGDMMGWVSYRRGAEASEDWMKLRTPDVFDLWVEEEASSGR
jgi:hypothetical protein